MPVNRLESLKSLVEQDPNNSFTRYGLAMEYVNSGRLDEALDQFRELMDRNPDYAAAYFHGGQTLEKLGRVDDARAMYRKGIEVTTRTGDSHTRSELEGVLEMLG